MTSIRSISATMAMISLISVWTLAGCSTASEKPKTLTKSEHARLLVDVANGALSEGDPTGALQQLAQAEELDNTLPELHHTKSLALYLKHNFEAALKEARKTVELAPAYSDANNTLGRLLIEAGRFGEAEKPLLLAANDNLYRDAYKPMTNLGILYYKQSNYPQADKYLTKATQEAPTAACVAYYYRGHLSLKNGKFDDAITQYEHATQRFCAKFGDAHLALGIAFERSKNYDRARKKFVDIKQNFPNTKIATQAMDHLKYLP